MQGKFCPLATRAVLVVALALAAAAGAAPAVRVVPAPRLLDLEVTNGSTPFAGDRRLLTTVSPNGDGFRDQAIVRFRLAVKATVELDVVQTVNVKHGKNTVQTIVSERKAFSAGRHRLVWTPAGSIPSGTYVLELTVTDPEGRRRIYNDFPVAGRIRAEAPVVRIQRIGVSMGPRYMPGQTAVVSVATDALSLNVDILSLRNGQGARDPKTNASPIAPPAAIAWRGHRSAPGPVRIRIGDWASGLYFVRITSRDGRVGYAPFVVRAPVLGTSRIAVVLPTNTWQAYNFADADGDGWGDSWYVNGAFRRVDISRPYIDSGIPYRFRDFDAAIMGWLSARGNVDFLTDLDLEHVANGDLLARDYDLIVFPGHEEYATAHEYNLVRRYRDLGGNLMFLSANNLFWKVVFHGHEMRRIGEWRNLGRPEASVVGGIVEGVLHVLGHPRHQFLPGPLPGRLDEPLAGRAYRALVGPHGAITDLEGSLGHVEHDRPWARPRRLAGLPQRRQQNLRPLVTERCGDRARDLEQRGRSRVASVQDTPPRMLGREPDQLGEILGRNRMEPALTTVAENHIAPLVQDAFDEIPFPHTAARAVDGSG